MARPLADVQLTNVGKVYWPADGITKGALLHYYAQVARWLVPHLRDRPMVMRRYPDGIDGTTFFMKAVPRGRPAWLATCLVRHRDGRTVECPLVQDLRSLLWVVNLGCIDLNPWYARAGDLDRPDCLWLDLDPGPSATFDHVREAALVVHDALETLGMPSYAKTTGSRGIHIAVPLVHGPTHDTVHAVAKALAVELTARHPRLLTVQYTKARRPPDRILLDYNQNGWGRTLASIYSVRPRPRAPVSMPLTWADVGRRVAITDFRLDNAIARLRRRGDLWAPVLRARGRYDLRRLIA